MDPEVTDFGDQSGESPNRMNGEQNPEDLKQDEMFKPMFSPDKEETKELLKPDGQY
jgi:hypothetical protein